MFEFCVICVTCVTLHLYIRMIVKGKIIRMFMSDHNDIIIGVMEIFGTAGNSSKC